MSTEVKDVVSRLRAVGEALASAYEAANNHVDPIVTVDKEPVFAAICEMDAAASLLESLSSQVTEAQNLAERMKLEAQCHAGEARTANSTIYEIYQVLSGGKGEPGNWHGAQPARDYVAAAEGRVALLEEALGKLLQANDDVQTVLCDGPDVPGFDPTELGKAQHRVTLAEAGARARLAKGGQ